MVEPLSTTHTEKKQEEKERKKGPLPSEMLLQVMRRCVVRWCGRPQSVFLSSGSGAVLQTGKQKSPSAMMKSSPSPGSAGSAVTLSGSLLHAAQGATLFVCVCVCVCVSLFAYCVSVGPDEVPWGWWADDASPSSVDHMEDNFLRIKSFYCASVFPFPSL